MRFLLVASLLLLGVSPAVLADAPKQSSYDLIYLGESGPVLLRLYVEVDGAPVQSAFDAYMKKWVEFLDRDNDGKLNAGEAQYLPNRKYASTFFRSGYFYYNDRYAPKMADFGKKQTDKLTVEDVVSYYQGNDVSALQQMSSYGYKRADESSTILFNQLDTDNDGKLSKEELASGLRSLRKYDLNDDEIITKQEVGGSSAVPIYSGRIVGGVAGGNGRPGQANNNANSSLYLVQPHENQLQISAVILAKYDKNKDTELSRTECGLDQPSFAKLDRDDNNALTVDELGKWHTSATPIAATVRLGDVQAGQNSVELHSKPGELPPGVKITHSGNDNVHLLFPDAKVALIGKGVSSKSMGEMNSGMSLTYTRYFQMANPKNKAFLTMQDLQATPRGKFLLRVFPVIDGNSDGKMTINEVYDFTKLAGQAKYVVSTLRISEEGQAIFELLDNNRDNRLSPRELLTSWKNLQILDRDKDGVLSGNEFSKQYSILLQRGKSTAYYVNTGGRNVLTKPKSNNPPARNAPLWFKKMDINNDGDVSPREFLGTASQFRKIDADGDGLIDPDEATNAASALTQSKK